MQHGTRQKTATQPPKVLPMKDAMRGAAFMKMHGLGNDFVIFDLRSGALAPDPALIPRVADRRRGIGCDQLVFVRQDSAADAELEFYNADGSRSDACGNATRCVARWLMDENASDSVSLRTGHRLVRAERLVGGGTSVNMGQPETLWHEIPLARQVDTDHLPIDGDPVATGMGNPHMTFFVPDLAAVDIEEWGKRHEHHPLYPERANVELVQVLSRDAVRALIWERGAGRTPASGSCSCALVVAAIRRGLTGRSVTVHLEGGMLQIDWRADGVWMDGPTTYVADGFLRPEWLEAR